MLNDQLQDHVPVSPRSYRQQEQQPHHGGHVELKRQSRVVASPPGLPNLSTGNSPSGQPSSGGRLLPYVPQRYVVPPGRTLSEGRRWARARGVSFKDDLEDLDESGVDVLDGAATSREEEEEDDLLDDLPPPADLIDVIGPAPSSRLIEEIPEPAPRDPDLLLNMVTYREQQDYREPVGQKSVDDYNGPYYPQASAGPTRGRLPNDYGSLRRNGHVGGESDDDPSAASRFTYGTYRRHQMSRFQRSEPQPAYPAPQQQQQQRHQRSASDQYDMSYFESVPTSVDDFAGNGSAYDGGGRQRPAMTRADSDESYRRYRRLSDNQSGNPMYGSSNVGNYSSDYRDKESPSYLGQGKPLVNLDPISSPYQQQQQQQPYQQQQQQQQPYQQQQQQQPYQQQQQQQQPYQQQQDEDLYQNVGMRRTSREDYGPTVNGYITNDYESRYDKGDNGSVMVDRTNDFSNLDPLNMPTDPWNSPRVGDPYSGTDDGSRIIQQDPNGYMTNYDPKDDPNVVAYNYQLQQQQQQEQEQQLLLQQQQQQLQLQQEQYQQYQQYKVEPVAYQGITEEQPLFPDPPNASSDGLDWSGGLMSGGHQGFTPAPPSCALDNNIQLTPSWEDRNVPQDQLNFHNFSVSMDRLDMEINPPVDRLNLIYLTLILHGIGTLMPWNMIITAKELKRGDWVYMLTQYFVTFKLGKEYTKSDEPYATYFLLYVGIAAQIPNVIFNWFNVFINVGGTLTTRIVWTLLVEVMVFVTTIVLAMVDTSQWPGLFFYLTVGCVAVLNMANGIYQNTVYGVAAKLPFKYTGAVVLGSNLSGTIVAIINIITVWVAPNPRTAAIYYFITALFILLACFDTYFALPLNRFYRYHNQQHTKLLQEKKKQYVTAYAMPYWKIFKQCFPQCFNVFFTYFVTLSIFPAVYSDVKIAHDDFFISSKYYSPVTCFFTFNICSVIGNLLSSACTLPGPRWLFVPVMLRFLFLPFFVLCNYRPMGVERLWPTLIHWDHAYWGGGALFGVTGGYLASLALMFCPRCVEPEYSTIAGMFGAASIVTGMIAGIGFSYLMPIIISTPGLAFEFPEWWPPYVAR